LALSVGAAVSLGVTRFAYGLLLPGMRADLNAIDPVKLSVGVPELMRDLPAGGKRFVQRAQGYVPGWRANKCKRRAW